MNLSKTIFNLYNINMSIISKLINQVELYTFRRKWRKDNKHNHTWASNVFQKDVVSVGNYTYGGIKVLSDVQNAKLKIGHFCSIGPEVVFLLGREHHLDTISTYPFKHYFSDQKYEAFSKGNIIVDDDVWIGHGSIILSGVHIGQGAVIGAGSVVTKDVSPYAVVGGNPVKVIKYRFDKEIIDELLKTDYSKMNDDVIKNNLDRLYDRLDSVEQLSWLPKK